MKKQQLDHERLAGAPDLAGAIFQHPPDRFLCDIIGWRRIASSLVLLLTLGLMLVPCRSFAPGDPCVPCAISCGAWECTTGSVNNPGTLSPASKEICVGGSPGTPSVSGTTFNPGSKKRDCNNCCDTWPETGTISYSAQYRWDPAIPATIGNCGTYSYNCYVKGVTTDTNCPSPTAEVLVGTYTVTVKAITGTKVSETMNDPVLGPVTAPGPPSPPPSPTSWPTGDDAKLTATITYCGGSQATLTYSHSGRIQCGGNNTYPPVPVNLEGTYSAGSPTSPPASYQSDPIRYEPNGGVWWNYTGWARGFIIQWKVTPGNCDPEITITQPKIW